MEKSVGEDPSLALRMTRRTGSGWQGIPGRAGNDGGESWNDGERAKGMVERVNIGKDGEKPVGKTRGRTVERTGIPGRAGNDEEENWNDGGENNGKDKGAKGFPVEPGMTETRTGMTAREQLK